MKTIRYEVYDKKDRWMGGYSTDLDKLMNTDSLTMAKINAKQCEGNIYKILEDNSKIALSDEGV